MSRRFALLIGLGCAAVLAGFFAIVWHPAVAPVSIPARSAFAAADIVRGAELTAVADCAVCHTAPGGRPYAGGRGIPTPFGLIYAANITPDAETGIGTWSLEAFSRAMRDGIGRDGRFLYPVLPYPHFTRATDADIAALYAFAMTRTPVRQEAPPNRLGFPFDQRWLLAGWNLLFLRPGPLQPDPAHDAVWNRGFYLVEGVGHCGACHSPHNVLGAEHESQALAGGAAEGWFAPPLQAGSPAPAHWTVGEIETYLRTGYDRNHGAAAGPMTAVTEELGRVPEADTHAIAVYVASLMPPGRSGAVPARSADVPDAEGSALFAGACGSCHAPNAPMVRGGAPLLSSSSSVAAPTALGVVQAILHGIPWREGRAAPYMPAFAETLTDAQIGTLATYVRRRWGGRDEAVSAEFVGRARAGEGS